MRSRYFFPRVLDTKIQGGKNFDNGDLIMEVQAVITDGVVPQTPITIFIW